MTSDEEQYTIETLNTLNQQKILTVFNMIETEQELTKYFPFMISHSFLIS